MSLVKGITLCHNTSQIGRIRLLGYFKGIKRKTEDIYPKWFMIDDAEKFLTHGHLYLEKLHKYQNYFVHNMLTEFGGGIKQN